MRFALNSIIALIDNTKTLSDNIQDGLDFELRTRLIQKCMYVPEYSKRVLPHPGQHSRKCKYIIDQHILVVLLVIMHLVLGEKFITAHRTEF